MICRLIVSLLMFIYSMSLSANHEQWQRLLEKHNINMSDNPLPIQQIEELLITKQNKVQALMAARKRGPVCVALRAAIACGAGFLATRDIPREGKAVTALGAGIFFVRAVQVGYAVHKVSLSIENAKTEIKELNDLLVALAIPLA